MKITFKSRIKEFLLKIIYWRPRYMRKFVLCRPRGGFNDMLCQIEKCRVYAIKNSRDLWIDSSRPGFHDCMSNYFEPSRKFYFGSPLGKVCDDASCFPTFLANKVDTYKPVYDSSYGNHVDNETGNPLTFDFDSRYDEILLVHEQCGGGINSIRMLAHLRLKKEIKHKIKRIIKNLGQYDAIHVRNTDLTTDYKKFFREINDKINGKVVVCTDDFECQQYSKEFWGDKLVIIHSVPDTSGTPLHKFKSADQYNVNLELLIDLFVLACAENFYISETDQGRVSGFAQLVQSIRFNPRVIKKVLN